jgi:hypothetical protein
MYNHHINILFDIVAWWKDVIDEETWFSCAIAIKRSYCVGMNPKKLWNRNSVLSVLILLLLVLENDQKSHWVLVKDIGTLLRTKSKSNLKKLCSLLLGS